MNVFTSSRLPQSARTSRGYTAIEVMLAMTVLLIGSAGVMSMQKASIQGNLDARKLDIANSIAHDWLERLTTDAMEWTLPAMNVNGANNFVNTTWLQTGWNNQGVFFLPTLPSSQAAAEGMSPAFDILGRDLASANPVFCVHVNIVQIAQDAQANPNLLRATVLVFWPKQLVQSGAVPSNFCGSYFDVASAEAANPGTWHMVYASTAIRKNPIN
jgi:prepilin-type N-terminal cleavage/methylation domain-containing protein